MNFENLIWLAVGVIVVAAITWKMARYFSPQAKWERRRRRSNAPIASDSKHPTVKFSVHVEKDKKD
jgi:hypothetical protein